MSDPTRTRRRRGGCEGCGAFGLTKVRGASVCVYCGRPDETPCPHCGRGEAPQTPSEIIERIGQRMRAGRIHGKKRK